MTLPVTDSPSAAESTPAPRKSGLIRSSAIYSALTMVSRFLGLARDLVITSRLGASFAGDAYYTALTFPNLFRRMFAEGAFAAAFVPEYSKRLAGAGGRGCDLRQLHLLGTTGFSDLNGFHEFSVAWPRPANVRRSALRACAADA